MDAKVPEQQLRLMVGDLIFQIATLRAENAALVAQLSSRPAPDVPAAP